MPEVSIQRAFQLAIQHHQAGRFNEAAEVYGEILKMHPNHPDALHLFGVLLHQMGDDNNALLLISQAIAENPKVGDYFCNLGSVLAAKEMHDDAIIAYRQAIALKPNYAEAYRNLGTALLEKGQAEDAVDAYRWSMALRPGHGDTYCNLGRALQMMGDIDGAIDACRQALAMNPDDADAHNHLGGALMASGRLDEAAAEFRAATDLRPESPDGWGNLGIVFHKQRKMEQAITYLRKALRIKPEDTRWLLELGEALRTDGMLEDAISHFRQVLALQPKSAAAFVALGNSLRDKGDTSGAIQHYRNALSVDPKNQIAYSNMLFSVHADPGYDARAIYEEHRRWAEQFATPLKSQIQPFTADRSPGRLLRVGYVSPDLYAHPVGSNILSLLQERDRKNFEVFCYASVERPDATTEKLRQNVDCWRDVLTMNDEKLAEQIRQDGIDILVDLSMHTGGHRLFVFARKPAPVQVSYLGFNTTTGLDTMDYRISDPYIDPPDSDLSCYTEKTLRLPRTYWCYNPETDTAVAPLPAIAAGHITFASMNSFSKVTSQSLDLWARVLLASPGSTLLIHSKAGSHLQELKKQFERNGVDPNRIEFVKRYPRHQYYQVYNHINVCLDTSPYGGGITTCDSLWMGVPVISMWGKTATGRAAASLLSNIGLPELIARTPDEYISIAAKLAGDISRLSTMREAMRPRMLASPILDHKGYARDMEALYRQAWQTYCKNGGA